MTSSNQTQQGAVGAMLRAMREGVGLDQTEVARRLGVSKTTLSRFENGHRVISPDLLSRVARVIADEITAKRRAA